MSTWALKRCAWQWGARGQREARFRITAGLLAWETGWMVTSRVISSGFGNHYLSEFFVPGFAAEVPRQDGRQL